MSSFKSEGSGWTALEDEFLSASQVLCILGTVVLGQENWICLSLWVWQAAWLPWQQLGWSHRTISSTALLALRASQQESLGSGEEEEEGREREGRERREGRTSWPSPEAWAKPHLALGPVDWDEEKFHLLLRAGLPHHWDPALPLCSQSAPYFSSVDAEPAPDTEKEGAAPHLQGILEPG